MKTTFVTLLTLCFILGGFSLTRAFNAKDNGALTLKTSIAHTAAHKMEANEAFDKMML